MSTKNDDILPVSYKYLWDAGSDLTLQDFLKKYKPSMVQNDGTKPWIWVQGSSPTKEDTGMEEVREEAAKLLKEVTEKVESIKNDTSIPLRSSKKTGAKSKKEVCEQVQAEATKKLKAIAIKHGYIGGKWLVFAPSDKVDAIWSSLATSLVSGPLHSTCAYLAKVSTSSEDEKAKGQHIICIYIPDVYDKVNITEVMKVLLRDHGATLSGVKADLYTMIGIDSKHPSGIQSMVWKNTAILLESEAKELKEIYFAKLSSQRPAPEVKPEAASPVAAKANLTQTAAAQTLTKPKLKKKSNDPFNGSDSENESTPEAKDKPKKAARPDTG